jgi:TPR repeat protein
MRSIEDPSATDLSRALALFDRGCRLGDWESCVRAGNLLTDQDVAGVMRDPARAATLFERACGRGSLRACNNLAQRYQNGDGRAQDLPRAVGLFERACDGGDAVSCFNLGALYGDMDLLPHDPDRARGYYRRGCELGDDWSCLKHSLALIASDPDGALAAARTACGGRAYAGCALGALLIERLNAGGGTAASACELARRGCDGGDFMSCSVVGRYRLEHGACVPYEPDRAEQDFRRGCEREFTLACENLAVMFLDPSRSERKSVAIEALDRACDLRSGAACGLLATILLDGTHVRRDTRRSCELARRAVGLGHGISHAILGVCADRGCVNRLDRDEAVRRYREGCAHGVSAACERARAIEDGARLDGRGCEEEAPCAAGLVRMAPGVCCAPGQRVRHGRCENPLPAPSPPPPRPAQPRPETFECPSGQERFHSLTGARVCCWSGQRLEGDQCVGDCPEGMIAEGGRCVVPDEGRRDGASVLFFGGRSSPDMLLFAGAFTVPGPSTPWDRATSVTVGYRGMHHWFEGGVDVGYLSDSPPAGEAQADMSGFTAGAQVGVRLFSWPRIDLRGFSFLNLSVGGFGFVATGGPAVRGAAGLYVAEVWTLSCGFGLRAEYQHPFTGEDHFGPRVVASLALVFDRPHCD